MTMTYEYVCPNCPLEPDQPPDLEVVITTCALLVFDDSGDVDGTDTFEARNRDHEWDSDSIMHCLNCEHQAKANTFHRNTPHLT